MVDLFPTGGENNFFPNQGGFFEDFLNNNHWNTGVPAVGVYRTLKENLSLGINFAFAGVTKIDGQTNQNLRYFSSDLQLKYAFFRDKSFSPYARLGAGVSSFNNDASVVNNIVAQKRSAGHWVSSIGFDLKFTDKFGFFLETNFKNAFGDKGISYFNHSLGFSYGLGTIDSDQDGVPDNRDECIDTPGLIALNGCPDQDGDGIRDSEDACPNKAGLAQFMGCPDADNDGIQDTKDSCPEKAGPEENQGCPDTDGDGLPDNQDNCPEEAGSVENNGCPDKDGDGVLDKDDACPDQAGVLALNGCPDQDGDGIADPQDNCVDEPGPAENNGCPWPDRDQDGIPDKDDDCPDEAANTASGCPIVESTIIDALNKAGINILFPADGSNLIGSKVLEAVAQVKTILEENPRGIVLIQGHASEDGGEQYNQALSKRRAESVKAKLIEMGVDPARLEVQAYGESRPIVHNDIAVSRRKSRRVVFSAKQ